MEEQMQYKNILVALDSSKASEKAFNKALQVAMRDDAHLMLAHVINTQHFEQVKMQVSDVYERGQAFGEELLDKYERKVNEAGFTNFKKILKFGYPKVVITNEIIPKEKADLIILGATGVSALERIFLGSVSEHIVRRAECDVLVVR